MRVEGLVGGVVSEQETKKTKGRGEGWSFMVGDFFLPRRLIDLVVLLRYLLTNEY